MFHNITKIFSFLTFLILSTISVFAQEKEINKEIVISIKPLHLIATDIMKGDAVPILLLEGNTSPHDFQLKPSHMKALQEAKKIFYIDNTFETFLPSTLKSLDQKKNAKALLNNNEIKKLTFRNNEMWKDPHDHHNHGHNDHNDHKEDKHHEEASHDHSPEGHKHTEHAHKEHEEHDHHPKDEHHHDHGHHHEMSSDPHFWLSPQNAFIIAGILTKELSALYPEKKQLYTKNLKKFSEKVEALDAELKVSLKGVASVPFYVFHDAYQYFEKTYNLNAKGTFYLDPSQTLSAKKMIKLKNGIKEAQVECVFLEPQFEGKKVQDLAKNLNLRTGVLDPLGTSLPEDDKSYFNLMKALANNLKACLGK